jgi:hypothetical protein
MPGEVLAAYAAASDRAKEAARERARLRKLVDQIPDGVWGGWRKSYGASARIVDLDRVRELLLALEVEVPMKDGEPRLVVSRVVESGVGGGPC